VLSTGRRIGIADPRLFGSFVEHLGRGVYGGIFEPTHPSATPEGFRRDVLDLVTELGVTVVRYPGGNFVSGYAWRDGVGPRSERPRRLDLAWKSIESNHFGTDEFIAWCREAGVEPMLALNLGLGDTKAALDLLEYSNFPGGTTLSDQRVSNGSPQPHNVRLWCLGNELDGAWQLGHRSAEGYAQIAETTASAMRMLDPNLELVAVGSSHADMPTFGTWEVTVLERTIELVDFISCHIYFFDKGDLAEFLRSSAKLDSFLDSVAATIDQARTITGSKRDVRISLDEWNVWDFTAYDDVKDAREFEEAPHLLEQTYTLADAVVVGTLLQSILRHANVVSIAALAQLVNAIGAIRTEPGGSAWRQTIFHPFAAVAKSANHAVLEVPDAPAEVPCVVTVSPDGTEARIYLSHLGLEEPAAVALALSGVGPQAIVSATVLAHPDSHATNSAANPDNVAPEPLDASLSDGRVSVTLPPLSWAVVTVRCQPSGA
jgi:alpha-N-arabinofuranosidase